MRRALDRGEIKVYFQPIVRLEDRTVAGFEALLRWDHPKLGRLDPGEFIPIAEETGAHRRLRHFRAGAHRARTRRLAARARRSTRRFSPRVNMSSRQLLRHDLAAATSKAIADRATTCRGHAEARD